MKVEGPLTGPNGITLYVVCPLCSIGAGKGQLHLGVSCDADLMITHGGVKKPHPKAAAKREVDGGVAVGNQISDRLSDQIERDIIDAETPHEVFDVANVLLVRLRRKEGIEKPFTIMDLPDVT